ncbi:glycosyltransferase family 4 protein [Endozoicomonas atrinae]|uniref:glycosyltransferase family 4 protein n=1 Tax=Endozoicomonas atrinae TaxID=1333660 RepID=UPI003B001460
MLKKREETILFYVNVKDISIVNDISFYEQDIRTLRENGYNVIITNKYRDVFFQKYDFLFIWWWSYALIPLCWAKIFSIKTIVTGAFHYDTPLMPGTDYVRRSYIFKLLVKGALKLADANIFVSKYEYDDVINNLPVNNPLLVHHGIDIDKYKPNPSGNVIQISEKRNDRTYNVLIISWIEKNNIIRKCVRESVMAVDMLINEGYNINLYIAGRKGNGYEEFYNDISKLPSFNSIHFLGHITEESKIELLSKADAFLSPTLYEGFGIAIAEALACGCPVITSKFGAVGEVVKDCALFVDPFSITDIRDTLKKLLNDESLRNTLSRKSRERIVEHFSYEKHKENLIKCTKTVFK